jgi:hypothetical protein
VGAARAARAVPGERETLTNVAHHARASHVDLSLLREDGEMVLRGGVACRRGGFQREGGCACFVRGGTLDDPTDIAPDVHIFTRSKVRSVTLPQGTPAFEVYYDPKRLWPAESLCRLEAVLPGRAVARRGG